MDASLASGTHGRPSSWILLPQAPVDTKVLHSCSNCCLGYQDQLVQVEDSNLLLMDQTRLGKLYLGTSY